MKYYILLFLCTSGFFISAQEFNDRQIHTLTSFGISSDKFNHNNQDEQTDFNAILKFERKRKRRKIGGIILASFGLLSASAATYGLIASKGQPYGELISGFILATGVLEMGGSIPIFVSSGRKKRQRDKIISKYNQIYQQPIQNK